MNHEPSPKPATTLPQLTVKPELQLLLLRSKDDFLDDL
jgi:hypothetical protein